MTKDIEGWHFVKTPEPPRPGDLMQKEEWRYMMHRGIRPSPRRTRQVTSVFLRSIVWRDQELLRRLADG